MKKEDLDSFFDLAERFVNHFLSPNVADANMEAANLVDTTFFISRSIGRIASQMQGSGRVTQSGEPATFADAVFHLADALEDIADAIRSLKMDAT